MIQSHKRKAEFHKSKFTIPTNLEKAQSLHEYTMYIIHFRFKILYINRLFILTFQKAETRETLPLYFVQLIFVTIGVYSSQHPTD